MGTKVGWEIALPRQRIAFVRQEDHAKKTESAPALTERAIHPLTASGRETLDQTDRHALWLTRYARCLGKEKKRSCHVFLPRINVAVDPSSVVLETALLQLLLSLRAD